MYACLLRWGPDAPRRPSEFRLQLPRLALTLALALGAAAPAFALPGAETSFYGNDLQALEKLARGALAQDARDGEAQAWLARALYRQGRFADARQALARAGSGLEAELARGDYALFVGEGEAAAEHFRRAAALAPQAAHPAWGLAYALLNLERFDPAVAAAEKAVALAKTPVDRSRALATLGGAQGLKANLGSLMDKISYGPKVKASLTAALKADGRNPGAHFALGRFYLQAPGVVGGDPAKALKPLARAVALDPYYFNAGAWYLKALAANGKQAEARAALADYKRKFAALPAAQAAVADLKL